MGQSDERDPEAVRADVVNELVSVNMARAEVAVWHLRRNGMGKTGIIRSMYMRLSTETASPTRGWTR